MLVVVVVLLLLLLLLIKKIEGDDDGDNENGSDGRKRGKPEKERVERSWFVDSFPLFHSSALPLFHFLSFIQNCRLGISKHTGLFRVE